MSVWRNLGERTVYNNQWLHRWLQVNMADVELPDGRHLDHTVIRLRPGGRCHGRERRQRGAAAWRHRFITDAWGWELPLGGAGEGEDPAVAAAREFEEETGWRPGPMRLLLAVDPMPGISTSHHRVSWSGQAERVGEPRDGFESARREWVPLKQVPELISCGEIRSANAVAALLMLHHMRRGCVYA